MLIDQVNITVRSGNGGSGAVSWRREKYISQGGPDGGDGGRGGSIIFQADHNQYDLGRYNTKKILVAENGKPGLSRRRHGGNGADLILTVPLGTHITDTRTKQVWELMKDGQQMTVAVGGKGGWGNGRLATSELQAPDFAKAGLPGQSRDLQMELSFLADLALIGAPNAGKSSLVNKLTGADLKTANYAFSTTEPALAVWEDNKVTVADLPGLIEGAHLGRGLGDHFLRHATRARVLIQLVDASQEPEKNLRAIEHELASYSRRLVDKPRLVVLNKIDLLTPAQLKKLQKDLPDAHFISLTNGHGWTELQAKLVKLTGHS